MTENRYVDTDMMEYNLSASQLKTFVSCPRQYWLKYIESMEPTKADSKYLNLGSRVHDSIEDVLKSNESYLDDREILRTQLRFNYEEHGGTEIPEDLYDRGLKCVEKAADVLHSEQPEIIGIEDWIEYDIDRGDLNSGVSGAIDLSTESGVWDWKTGRVRDQTPIEEKIQGAVYMGAYLNHYGHPPEEIKFIYLSPHATEDGAVARSVDVSDETWSFMLDRARELQEAKKTGEFEAKPGDKCVWCSHEGWCEASPTGMGGVPVDEY